MSQPTPYNRQASFTTLQQEAPTDPLPGDDVDAEYNAIKTTLDQILANLELIQRDDGQLANESVGRDQLAANLSLGFNAPTSWATDTNYTTLDTVFFEQKFYRCLVSHLSDDFETDLGAGNWEMIADFSVVVVGAGDVVGPASATDGDFAQFDGTTGRLLKDGVGLDTDTALAANSDSKVASQKAVKAYADAGDAAVVATLGDLAALDTVGSSQIDNDAVTYAKMQNVTATSRILGRKTASAGNPEECTLSEILDFIGSAAHGDILYRDSASWARLGAGTSGQFLKTQGTGANPTWADSASRIDVQEFLSSGDWTKPSGYSADSRVFMEAWGGGGGGGRMPSFGTGGGGGGGGGYSYRWAKLSDLGSTETITIGAGGAGRGTNGDGSTGGNTTIGSLLTAYGGAGGEGAATGNHMDGGGGGGPLSAGSGNQPGRPLITSGTDDYIGSGVGSKDAIDHGAGGGFSDSNIGTVGGSSLNGGGGGGGGAISPAAGGTSINGGAGGAGIGNSTASNGVQPGGGGGGSRGDASTSGTGADGMVRITVFPA